MDYAGFWVRFLAKFLDGIIQMVAGLAIGMFVGLLMAKAPPMAIMATTSFLGICSGIFYCTFFIGKYGATPGKMALKLRVVNPDGSPVGYGKACGRYFSEILSSFTLLIGYIMAAFDEEKRALHDRICNTRVIRK